MQQKVHLARFEEIPNIPLLLDQVLLVANEALAQIDENAQLTASMVNNYTKRKLIPAPLRKRYGREQICMLVWICLLKSALDLDGISAFFEAVTKSSSLSEAYDGFCCNVEALLGAKNEAATPLDELVLASAQAVASQVRLHQLIEKEQASTRS